MIHPYITAYEETGSYRAAGRQFNVDKRAIMKIVHPQKYEEQRLERNVRDKEVRRVRKNNKRYLEYFGKLASG